MISRSRPRSDRQRSRTRTRSKSAPLDRGLLAALLLTTIGAPLLLGGALESLAIVIAVLALGWAALAVAVAIRTRAPVVLTSVIAAAALVLAWTALQSLPLPRAIVEWSSPDALARQDATHLGLGEAAPAFVPTTFDPGGSRRALVALSAVLAALIAASITATRIGRRPLVAAVALSTVAMAVVAGAHVLADASSVFGVYQPRFASPVLLAPLMNSNHLGGFVAMGAPVALALAVDSEKPAERMAWGSAALINASVAVATLSRAALVSLLVGFVVLAALVARRRVGGVSLRTTAIAAALGTLVLVAALYVSADRAIAQFESDDYLKLEVISEALSLSFAHGWIGVGRGAFAAAFSERMGVDAYFEFAECLPVQWAADWGIPIALGLIATLTTVWFRAAQDATSWARLGACAGLASIVSHDFVDFALELPAVALVAGVLLVAATAPRRRASDPSASVSSTGDHYRVASGLIVACAAAIAIGAPWRGPTDARERADSLLDAVRAEDWDRFDGELRTALLDHPGDARLVLVAASTAVSRDRPDALRWINYAMRLAPHWPGPHLLAARWLLAHRAHAQAHLEIREAERRDPGSGSALVCALLDAGRTTPELIQIAAPPPPDADLFLDRAAGCLGWQDAVGAEIDDLVPATSVVAGPLLRRARRARAAGRLEDALTMLGPSLGSADSAEGVVDLGADILLELGRSSEARAILESRIAATGASVPLLTRLALVATAEGDEAAMRDTVTRIRGRASGDPQRLASAYRLLGGLERRLQNSAHALAAYEQAYRLGQDPESLRRVAELAESLGDRRRALGARSELCRNLGPASADCAARERLETAALEPFVPGVQRTTSP